MNRLRVGIIGAGFSGRQHLDAVRRIPGTEVAAVADCNEAAARVLAENNGIPHYFADYRDMLDSMQLDVVHNCTPNALHYEINSMVMKRGAHIYCEKPLGVTTQESAALLQLAESTGVANGVNFNYRSNAMAQEIRQRVQSGGAGRCMLVRGSYLQDWLMDERDYNWRMETKNGLSRAMADIGSHWFDTAQTACGKRIVAVNARLMTLHPTRLKPKAEVETFAGGPGGEYTRVPIHTEDAGFVMMEFEGGLQGMLVVSQVSGGYKNELCLSVDCTNYSMRWNQQSADQLIIGSRNLGEQKLYAAPDTLTGAAKRYATLPGGHGVAWADALRNGIGAYYASIRNGNYREAQQPYATFADGDGVMRIVDACLESSRENRWVEVH